MNTSRSYVRQGVCAVRPYLYGPLSLVDFVKEVFGAEELERYPFSETAFHIEARIDDSIFILEVSDPPYDHATKASVYVYVRDVDAAFQRALNLGAVSVQEPVDKPYGERNAGVRDGFGNIWWIGTFTGTP